MVVIETILNHFSIHKYACTMNDWLLTIIQHVHGDIHSLLLRVASSVIVPLRDGIMFFSLPNKSSIDSRVGN